MDGFVEVASGLLDRLGWDRCVVHGHSMGAAVALRLAHARSHTVSALVLPAPIIPFGLRRMVLPRRASLNTTAGFVLPVVGPWLLDRYVARHEHGVMSDERALAAGFADLASLPPATFECFADEARGLVTNGWRRRGLVAAARSLLMELYSPTAARRWSDIAAPMLVLWGKRDEVLPRSMLESAQRRRPDLQVIELDDASHIPPVDTPEAYCSHAWAWLQALDGDSATGSD